LQRAGGNDSVDLTADAEVEVVALIVKLMLRMKLEEHSSSGGGC